MSNFLLLLLVLTSSSHYFDYRVSVECIAHRNIWRLNHGMVGKTIQVISFLSAIMEKHGDRRDVDRRRSYVSKLQDGVEWKKHRTLPPANAVWPTCLIIAPSTVVPNWEREFETVSTHGFL